MNRTIPASWPSTIHHEAPVWFVVPGHGTWKCVHYTGTSELWPDLHDYLLTRWSNNYCYLISKWRGEPATHEQLCAVIRDTLCTCSPACAFPRTPKVSA